MGIIEAEMSFSFYRVSTLRFRNPARLALTTRGLGMQRPGGARRGMTRHDTVNPELDFQFRVFLLEN